MIDTTIRTTIRMTRPQLFEGWVERVDTANRRLHVRTGSRDRLGACIEVPLECDIHHDGFRLGLQSLLPCDAVNIFYTQKADGARIATDVELRA